MEDTHRLQYGRTYPAHCRPLGDVTLKPCLKRSQRAKFQCLVLDAGQRRAWYEAEGLTLLGACTTRSNVELNIIVLM